MNKVYYILFVTAVAALTVFLYSNWGLKGSAGLLAVFVVLYGVAKYRIKRGEQQVLDTFKTMSVDEARRMLEQMDPEDRKEVVAIRRKALKRRMEELKRKRNK